MGYIYLIGNLRNPQEYFMNMTAGSNMDGENGAVPMGNPLPLAGCQRTFPCMAGEEASLSFT